MDLQFLGTDKISSTYIVNKSGPKMEPCGTPTDRGKDVEMVSCNYTTCVRIDK